VNSKSGNCGGSPAPDEGPNQFTVFAHGDAARAHLVDERDAVGRFRRGIDDASVEVELPTVEEAAQSAVFVAREHERGAAMWAKLLHHSDATVAAAKGNEVFAKQANLLRCAVRFECIGLEDRIPVTAQQRTAAGLRSDARDQLVVFLAQHSRLPIQAAWRRPFSGEW
jgi:hypothetical protein